MKRLEHAGSWLPVAVTLVDDQALSVAVPQAGFELEALERALILFALQRAGGNRTHAARFLGLTRSALLYRIQKYRLAQAAATPDGSGELPGGVDRRAADTM